jgi:hypothetical protein
VVDRKQQEIFRQAQCTSCRAREGQTFLVRLLALRAARVSGAEAGMGTFPTVLDAPFFDLEPRIVERNEDSRSSEILIRGMGAL